MLDDDDNSVVVLSKFWSGDVQQSGQYVYGRKKFNNNCISSSDIMFSAWNSIDDNQHNQQRRFYTFAKLKKKKGKKLKEKR